MSRSQHCIINAFLYGTRKVEQTMYYFINAEAETGVVQCSYKNINLLVVIINILVALFLHVILEVCTFLPVSPFLLCFIVNNDPKQPFFLAHVLIF